MNRKLQSSYREPEYTATQSSPAVLSYVYGVGAKPGNWHGWNVCDHFYSLYHIQDLGDHQRNPNTERFSHLPLPFYKVTPASPSPPS